MIKKAISAIVRTSVSLILILILLYIMRDKYGEILDALKKTSAYAFGLGLVVFICAIALASYRLKLIIETQGEISVTLPEIISLTFIGYFFNNFLPTSIGGDVVKAYYLSRKATEKTGSFTSVFVDRAIGLITMVFMAFVALLFVPNHVIDHTVKTMIYAITIASILVIAFMANDRIAKKFSILLTFVRPIEEKIIKAYYAIHNYKHHTRLMLESLGISILSQLLFFASIGILAVSIGSYIPVLDILLKMPLVSLMSLLPSINGLGLREGSTVVLFGSVIGKEKAFAISILWLAVLFIISILGGLIYALSPQFKMRLKESA